METTTIKFYRNYKDGRYFVSGKNEQGRWFYLYKTHNTDLYLDNEKFAKGLEIDKSKLTLKEKDDKDCNILVFKTAELEREFCVSKEELAKRKEQKKVQSTSAFDFVKDIIIELFEQNEELIAGKLITSILQSKATKENETFDTDGKLVPVDDDNLPF